MIKLFTRGDGVEGQDITNLIKYLELPNWEDINKYVRALSACLSSCQNTNGEAAGAVTETQTVYG